MHVSVNGVRLFFDDGPRRAGIWGDDVRTFCDALGIVDPIVLGASFGSMVALAYATRHPAYPTKLVLISTEAAGGSHPERRVAAACHAALLPDPARSRYGAPRRQGATGGAV
jgi:pimeloyl-ACP methyl ester carboxylesterase